MTGQFALTQNSNEWHSHCAGRTVDWIIFFLFLFFAMSLHSTALARQHHVFTVFYMLDIEQGETWKHKCVRLFELKLKKFDLYFSISELEIQSLESG